MSAAPPAYGQSPTSPGPTPAGMEAGMEAGSHQGLPQMGEGVFLLGLGEGQGSAPEEAAEGESAGGFMSMGAVVAGGDDEASDPPSTHTQLAAHRAHIHP